MQVPSRDSIVVSPANRTSIVKKILLYLTLMQLPVSLLAQDYLPRDVQRFVDRREGCDHMRGELERANELGREIRKLCGGTDKELAQLKRKYAANSTIMQILNQFEASIEAAEAPPLKSDASKRKG
jgi:hypothetical protein